MMVLGRLAQTSIPGVMSALTVRVGALGVGARTISAARMQPQEAWIARTRCHSVLSNSTSCPKIPVLLVELQQQQHQQIRQMGSKSHKTNKSAAKRFRVRGSGSIKRNKAGMSHNTGYKAKDRKSRLASSCGVKGKAIEKRMRRLIGA